MKKRGKEKKEKGKTAVELAQPNGPGPRSGPIHPKESTAAQRLTEGLVGPHRGSAGSIGRQDRMGSTQSLYDDDDVVPLEERDDPFAQASSESTEELGGPSISRPGSFLKRLSGRGSKKAEEMQVDPVNNNSPRPRSPPIVDPTPEAPPPVVGRTGKLFVVLQEADGIFSGDNSGKSEPFCVLEVNDQMFVSDAVEIENGEDPLWQQPFEFVVEDTLKQQLLIGVFDGHMEHLGKEPYIGEFLVPLDDIHDGMAKEVWAVVPESDARVNLFLEFEPDRISAPPEPVGLKLPIVEFDRKRQEELDRDAEERDRYYKQLMEEQEQRKQEAEEERRLLEEEEERKRQERIEEEKKWEAEEAEAKKVEEEARPPIELVVEPHVYYQPPEDLNEEEEEDVPSCDVEVGFDEDGRPQVIRGDGQPPITEITIAPMDSTSKHDSMSSIPSALSSEPSTARSEQEPQQRPKAEARAQKAFRAIIFANRMRKAIRKSRRASTPSTVPAQPTDLTPRTEQLARRVAPQPVFQKDKTVGALIARIEKRTGSKPPDVQFAVNDDRINDLFKTIGRNLGILYEEAQQQSETDVAALQKQLQELKRMTFFWMDVAIKLSRGDHKPHPWVEMFDRITRQRVHPDDWSRWLLVQMYREKAIVPIRRLPSDPTSDTPEKLLSDIDYFNTTAFRWITLAIKLNHSQFSDLNVAAVDWQELHRRAMEDDIPVGQWPEWIDREVERSTSMV